MSKKLQQKNHAFNIEIAKKYGIEEAILLKNISFWIDHNKANDKNFHDGKYWTYNSAKAFQKIFPYLSEYKIKRVLKKLEEEKILLTGNYNKNNYDRTKWYALSEKGEQLIENPKKPEERLESQQSAISNDGVEQNQPMEKTKSTNGKDKINRPIPNINTDKKHIKNNNKKNQKNVVVSQKTIKEIKEKTKNRVSKKDIENIINQTGATEEELLKQFRIMSNTANTINNPVGWLIKGIKKGYKASKSFKPNNNSKKNEFHKFQGNENQYTERELERKLGLQS